MKETENTDKNNEKPCLGSKIIWRGMRGTIMHVQSLGGRLIWLADFINPEGNALSAQIIFVQKRYSEIT